MPKRDWKAIRKDVRALGGFQSAEYGGIIGRIRSEWRLEWLANRVGLDKGPSRMTQLAVWLASALFPPPARRGRQKLWTQATRAALIVHYESERKHRKGKKKLDIMRALEKQEPWKSMGTGRSTMQPGNSLLQQYNKAVRDVDAQRLAKSLLEQCNDDPKAATQIVMNVVGESIR